MTDLREAMALVIDGEVRQALRDYGISDEAMRGDPELWSASLLTADAALAAIEATGFAVVPKEATEEMVEAGMAARNKMAGRVSGVIGQTTDSSWRHEFWHELAIYAAMLDAAPKR